MIDWDATLTAERYGIDFGGVDDHTYDYLCMEATTFNGVAWSGNFQHTTEEVIVELPLKPWKLALYQALLLMFGLHQPTTLKMTSKRVRAIFEFGSEANRVEFVRAVKANWCGEMV